MLYIYTKTANVNAKTVQFSLYSVLGAFDCIVLYFRPYGRRSYAMVDIGRRRPTSGTENGGDTNPKWKEPMSGDLGPCRQPGVVVNVGVDVEIASPSLSVQKLFLLPVSSLPF